jgi:hypothetical protein
MAGGPHELRVVVVSDREASDEELADVHAVNGAFVLLPVGSAHQEFAGRNAREIRRRGERHRGVVRTRRGFFLHFSAKRPVYSLRS